MINESIGEEMYKLAKEIFPINRSITGEGVRKTFDKSKISALPDLQNGSLLAITSL